MELIMNVRVMFAGILATVVMGVGSIQAAVIAPVKQYAKPNEPVEVRFLNENEQGKKALEKIGIAAARLDGMFTEAAEADVVGSDGGALFSLYTFDGKKVEGSKAEVKRAPGAGVDISAYYPIVKEAGTYVLTWKDATPLVIETLRNPIPWAG